MTEPKKKPVKKAPAKKAPAKKAVAKPAKFKPPVSDRVSCEFGVKGTVWICGHHTGVDYAAKKGTKVHAVADGVVVAGNWGPAYGIHMIIQHYSYRYIYAHLDSKAGFPAGTKIKQGEVIGISGDTGSSKAGAHLHLEARKQPYRYAIDAVDPRKCL
jgi:murein DD-endopeptidase MepM/ murein hydrolase activator NlpD